MEAHEDALQLGGATGIARLDGLEGAIGRPYHGYHRFIHQKAAALLHGIATSHAFIDGNKRTALLLTYLLIDRSGFDLMLRESEQFDDVIVDVVNHTISEAELVEWFRERLVRDQ